jgi:hypothetical protein
MTGPVTALALAEGRRVVRNPLIWVSLVPTVFWVRATMRHDGGEDLLFLLIGYGLGLTGFVMVTTVVIATLRGRLEHTEELLGTLAVGPDRRSIGHAGSTLALAAIGAVVTVVLLAVLRPADPLGTWDPSDTGVLLDVPRPNVAQLVQGPLAIVAVATFAIALVRWLPTWLVLAPMLYLLMVQMLFMGTFHGVPADGGRWMFPLGSGVVNGPWSGCGPDDELCTLAVDGFDRLTPWWHAAYLVSLAGLFTVVAVLRHRRDRVTWTWFGASLAVVIVVTAIQFMVAEEFVAS